MPILGDMQVDLDIKESDLQVGALACLHGFVLLACSARSARPSGIGLLRGHTALPVVLHMPAAADELPAGEWGGRSEREQGGDGCAHHTCPNRWGQMLV